MADPKGRPTPPPGGKEITLSGEWRFHKFEVGTELHGELKGTTDVNGEPRWVVGTKDGDLLMPNHWELNRKLEEAAKVGAVDVWILHTGEEKVEGKPQPIKRYTVHAYPR